MNYLILYRKGKMNPFHVPYGALIEAESEDEAIEEFEFQHEDDNRLPVISEIYSGSRALSIFQSDDDVFDLE